MVIWGWRSYVRSLAMLTFLCGNCGNPAMHHVKRAYTKFTLFFIPLFPISSKYYTECTFCGVARRIDKAEALRLQEQAQQPGMVPDQQAWQQPMPQQTPPGGYPQHGYYPPVGQPQQPGYPPQQHPYQGHPQPQVYPQQQGGWPNQHN